MQEQTLELSVGDVLQIGDREITIVDIDGPEVSFRIDDWGWDELNLGAFEERPPQK